MSKMVRMHVQLSNIDDLERICQRSNLRYLRGQNLLYTGWGSQRQTVNGQLIYKGQISWVNDTRPRTPSTKCHNPSGPTARELLPSCARRKLRQLVWWKRQPTRALGGIDVGAERFDLPVRTRSNSVKARTVGSSNRRDFPKPGGPRKSTLCS